MKTKITSKDIIGLIIVIVILTVLVIHGYNSWKLNYALSFPTSGYITEHPTIDVGVKMQIKPDINHKNMRIITKIQVINRGNKTLKNITLSARLNDKIYDYTSRPEWTRIYFEFPQDLPPLGDNTIKSLVFNNIGYLRDLTGQELQELYILLKSPVKVKLMMRGKDILFELIPEVEIE